MYDLIYEKMVDAGIAIFLPEVEQYWIDDVDKQVQCEKDTVRHVVKVEINHTKWLLFGYKVGTELSMEDDGHIVGTTYVTAKGTRANIKSSF